MKAWKWLISGLLRGYKLKLHIDGRSAYLSKNERKA